MLPFYKISVNEDDETGIDFNAWVDYPAHMKNFVAFGKQFVRLAYSVDKAERKVTGVMISANTPIYRNDPHEHYVFFTPEVIEVIRRKFIKNGFMQNLNSQHEQKDVINGVILVDSFIINNSNPNYPNTPEAFAKMNLQDGTWIGTYFVEDDKVWKDVVDGKWGGFSVEGWFDLMPASIKKKFSKQTKTNNMKKKSIFAMLFGKETFAEATTADGTILKYDGELAVGTVVMVEAEGVDIPAPEGNHEITLEDGSVKLIVLDGSGAVTEIEDFVPEDMDEVVEELRSEVAEALKKVLKDTNDRFDAVEKENKNLKAEIESMKAGGKFGANPKKGATTTEKKKLSVSEMMKNSK